MELLVHDKNYKTRFKRQTYIKRFLGYQTYSRILISGATTYSEGLSFNWADPSEGLYMVNPSLETGRGEESLAILDKDGTLTGQAGSTTTATGWYFTEGLGCQERQGWNMEICPDTHFAKVSLPRDLNF